MKRFEVELYHATRMIKASFVVLYDISLALICFGFHIFLLQVSKMSSKQRMRIALAADDLRADGGLTSPWFKQHFGSHLFIYHLI
jgi:hypothetical protein